jgi:hypothetical protein
LPLNAAGLYERLSQDHIGKNVISSYTPTISALYLLLEETVDQQPSFIDSKVLLVGQPMSVHLSSLSRGSLIPSEHLTYLNDVQGALVSDTLERLKTAHVVHLACHSHQYRKNPLNTAFEPQNARSTLEQLMRVDTSYAQLAYLSACDPAGMNKSRPDEGLNLVGTMIFVSFRSVIGTMW